MAEIHVKRVYEQPELTDGRRILVDRLWPRGISKEKTQINRWAKEISPSHELRKTFHGNPERWEEFKARYFAELDEADGVAQLLEEIESSPVTLLFAAKDVEHNNAVALREYLLQRLEP